MSAAWPAPRVRRKYVQTPEQRRGIDRAGRRVLELREAGELDDERHGEALLASLGPNEGYLTRESSPHVMWLADRLQGKPL